MDSDNRLIAEFERHHGTIVMYPFRKDIWRDNAYYMRKYVVQLAQCIAQYEHVYLIWIKSIEKSSRCQNW